MLIVGVWDEKVIVVFEVVGLGSTGTSVGIIGVSLGSAGVVIGDWTDGLSVILDEPEFEVSYVVSSDVGIWIVLDKDERAEVCSEESLSVSVGV